MNKTKLTKKSIEERLAELENGRADFVQSVQYRANMQIAQYDGRILGLQELLAPPEEAKETDKIATLKAKGRGEPIT